MWLTPKGACQSQEAMMWLTPKGARESEELRIKAQESSTAAVQTREVSLWPWHRLALVPTLCSR